MSLRQTHIDSAHGATPGARAAIFIKGFASHVQAALNDPYNLAVARELCVEAAQMADDVALTIDHGEEADAMREEEREQAERRRATSAPPVAPSIDTPREPASPHAAPTDTMRAPTPEREGTVAARPTMGERAQSAPKGDGPGPGTAKDKEDHAAPAGDTSADKREHATHTAGRR